MKSLDMHTGMSLRTRTDVQIIDSVIIQSFRADRNAVLARKQPRQLKYKGESNMSKAVLLSR